jgi:predicted ferric reductase
VLGGIVWHVLPFEFWKLIFPTISIGIFSLVTLFRIIRTGPRAYIQSIPESIPDQSIIRFNVKTRGDLKIKPGQFHYLYFSGLRWRYRFQGHPFMVAWCEYEAKGEEKFTNLTFLLQPQRGLTARLINELRLSILRSETITSLPVRFGGPYGQDLHLEKYQTVILVAKGIGIAGVLPYAGYLGRRILHDIEIKNQLTLTSTQSVLQRTLHRDATAKVDLFWELDHNGQEDCVADHLRTLQDQDPGRVSILVVHHLS